MIKVAVWSDGSWCLVEDLNEFHWKSDDYFVEEITEDVHLDELDDYVFYNLFKGRK